MSKLLILMTALAFGCQQQPDSVAGDDPIVEPDPDPVEQVAGIKFAKSRDLARSGQFLETFSLMGQRDIIAVIEFEASDLPSDGDAHLIQFRLINSSGAEQLTYWLAVATDSSAPTMVPHPVRGQLEVQHLAERDGWLRVYASIPIAGSAFTRYHLTGLFYAEANLGGDGTKMLTNAFEMAKR